MKLDFLPFALLERLLIGMALALALIAFLAAGNIVFEALFNT